MQEKLFGNHLLPYFRSFIIGILILLSFNPYGQEVKSSHIRGLEIYYECIGTCSIRVYQRAYVECGASISPIFSNSATWVVGGPCPLPTPLGSASPVISTEITPVCPTVTTTCTGQATINGVRIEENYQDFSYCALVPNCIATISFATCCRNPAITNITQPTGLYYGSLTLNAGIPTCNNSPRFSSPANQYFCQGQPFQYDLGAHDPDGDSLAYSLGPCYQQQNYICLFNPGFTPTTPLGPSWSINLDSQTGNFTATPQPGNIVVAILCVYVEEWRNGALIGTSSRDITLTIIPCPANSMPAFNATQNISGGIQTSPDVFELCPGSTLSFDISASDADVNQTQILYWDSNIPGASFHQTGNPTIQDTITGPNPSGHFTFTPTTNGQYSFLLSTRDDACPIYGEVEKLIVINVNSPTPATASISGCNTAQFQAAPCGGQAPFTYSWSGDNNLSNTSANFSFSYPGPGSYAWQCIITDANSVADTITDTLVFTPPFVGTLIPGPDTIDHCPNQNVAVQAASGLASYQWSNGATNSATFFSLDGWHYLTAIDSAGCTYQDSIYLNSIPTTYASIITNSPSLQLDPCNGQTNVIFSTSGTYSNYLWSNGTISQTNVVTQPGTYSITATDANGCLTQDSVDVTITGTNLYGTVTTHNQAPLVYQKVYLVNYNPVGGTLTGVDTVTTDQNGFYYFCGLNTITSYFVKAAPDSADYPNEIPTYADSSLVWNNATPFYPATAGPYQVDFSTIGGANPGGPGFIGGLISQGANKNDGPGDPVANLRIYLINASNQIVMGIADTDSNGYFSIGDLPYGTYKVVPDQPYVDEVNVPEITLNTNNAQPDSLDFRLYSSYLDLVLPTPITQPDPGFSFTISPNPVSGEASIQLELPELNQLKIELFDIQGRQLSTLYEGTLNAGTYRQNWEPKEAAGVYFIRLEGNGISQLQKVILLGN